LHSRTRLQEAHARLEEVRRRLPQLRDRAYAALVEGNEELARLTLHRRRVLEGELESLDARPLQARLLKRIEAANRLLEASLSELTGRRNTPAAFPRMLDFDPLIEAELAALRDACRRETA
jgi:phage shock protein A